MMIVKSIDLTKRRDIRRFVKVPFDLYKACEYWIPPLVKDVAFTLNPRKHPYYEHSDADFILAEQDGQVLGRLAVLHPKKHNAYREEKSAFFYFFECVNDPSVCKALLDYGLNWAKIRGLDRMIGPLGFIPGEAKGLLVDGFQYRPAMGMPYNYEYYDRLLSGIGFQKYTDYYSGYLPGNYVLPERFFRIAWNVATRRGFWIKSFRSKRELKKWIYRIQDVYNAAFSENFEYSPLTKHEAIVIAEKLISISIPRMIKLVMKGSEIIGFLFDFVDISEEMQRSRGRILPFGWLRIKRSFQTSKCLNFNGIGLLQGHRGVGANAVLYTEMARTLAGHKFNDADVVQIEEGNVKSLRDMNAIRVEWRKTHRIYERKLA